MAYAMMGGRCQPVVLQVHAAGTWYWLNSDGVDDRRAAIGVIGRDILVVATVIRIARGLERCCVRLCAARPFSADLLGLRMLTMVSWLALKADYR